MSLTLVSDSKQGVSPSAIHSVKLLPKEIKGGVSWMKKSNALAATHTRVFVQWAFCKEMV